MTRAPEWLAAVLLLAGCGGPGGSPGTARARPPAGGGTYCTAVRELDATLSNSIDKYASSSTLSADAKSAAGRFDSVASGWRAAGNASWRLAAATAGDLRAWAAAVDGGDDERANQEVLALWRDERGLPACPS